MNKFSEVESLSICIPVWGEDFVSRFIRYSLPTITNITDVDFFNNNLVEIHFFTDLQGQKKLGEIDFSQFGLDVIFHDIAQEIGVMNDGKRGDKYRVLNACHEKGMRLAYDNHQAYMPLVADVLISKGAISYAFNIIKQGYVAVFSGNIRLVSEVYQAIFTQVDLTQFEGWASHELVDIALNDIHPKVDMTTINTPLFDHSWPDFLYWVDQKEGMIQRGVFLHPFVFVPNANMTLSMHTIDVNLEGLAVEDTFSNVYVVRSSDEFVCASMCDRHEFDHIRLESDRDFDVSKLGEFLAFDQAVKPINIFFLSQSIIFKRQTHASLHNLLLSSEITVRQALSCYEKFNQLILEQGLTSTDNRLELLLAKYEDTWLETTKQKVSDIVQVNPSQKIAVYGFGDHSELLMKYTALSPHISVFSDSNPDTWGKFKQGVRCVPPQDILKHTSTVLVSSRDYEQEIKSGLIESFGNKLSIFTLYDSNEILD